MIQDTLDGQASDFLSQKQSLVTLRTTKAAVQSPVIFRNRSCMCWLAIEREPISCSTSKKQSYRQYHSPSTRGAGISPGGARYFKGAASFSLQ